MIKISDLLEKKDKIYYLIQPQNSTELREAIDIEDVKTLMREFADLLLNEVIENVKTEIKTNSSPYPKDWENVVNNNSIKNVIELINFD